MTELRKEVLEFLQKHRNIDRIAELLKGIDKKLMMEIYDELEFMRETARLHKYPKEFIDEVSIIDKKIEKTEKNICAGCDFSMCDSSLNDNFCVNHKKSGFDDCPIWYDDDECVGFAKILSN